MKKFILLFAILTLPSCDRSKSEGHFFAQKAMSQLDLNEALPVADIYPGDWSEVCVLLSMSTSGGFNEKKLRERFNISPNAKLDLPFGIFSTSDENWGIMFVYPNNKIEAISISNRTIFGDVERHADDPDYPICFSKSDAYLQRVKYQKSGTELLLIKSIKKDASLALIYQIAAAQDLGNNSTR